MLETRFAEALDTLLPEPRPKLLGLAVSGGSDSTALMHLAAAWAGARNLRLHVVTIDHGLRKEASGEAAGVARQAAELGLPHSTLRWGGWDGHGNLQNAARNARHGLIDLWRGSISHVLLGHTMDDQAETLCLNLARGSGVAGLSGMAARFRLSDPPEVAAAGSDGPMPAGTSDAPLVLLRPLLKERRLTLRDWLRERGIDWIDDPSNEDRGSDRVRLRQALAGDNPFGLTVEGLAATAERQRRARRALEARAADVARRIVRVRHGDVLFDREPLAALEEETRLALLAHALQWVSSARYRPRSSSLSAVLEGVFRGRAGTLHGCLLIPSQGEVRVTREERAVTDLLVPLVGVTTWDRRWRISGPHRPGAILRALGQGGLAQLRDLPREPGPRAAFAACPAVYDGDRVVAVPGLLPSDWTAELRPPVGGFVESLLTA